MRRSGESIQLRQLTDLVTAAFTLCLLDRSLTNHSFDKIVRRAHRRAYKNAVKLVAKKGIGADNDETGHVVYHWQRSPGYLDKNGKPVPIPARGPAPSVEALFKQLGIQKNFETALLHLRKFRQVRVTKAGLYYPKSEATIYPRLTPEVIEMLTQTMNRLVETVLKNTSPRRKGSLPLVERRAFVPDLPLTELPEFKRFVREQAGGLVETVNEWLEGKRGRSPRKPNSPGRVAAGLHTFAFFEDGRK